MDRSTAATSEDLVVRQVHTYPVSDEEARIRGREGPRPSAGAAFSARDISVAKCCIPDNEKNLKKLQEIKIKK